MKIEPRTVAIFHYDLADGAGRRIESSRTGRPLAVLHGAGNVIAGVEAALAGREPGARFTVTVPPEQGYGERRDGLVQRVPKKHLRDPQRLRPGDSTVLATRDGQRMVSVLKVGQSVVDVDLNHPMAGRTLVFDIEVLAVREATPEEIEHGHAHEPGGHPH